MSLTKITTPELLDFPNDTTTSINTSGTVIPTGYIASCTFPDAASNIALYTMFLSGNDSCSGSLNLTNNNGVPFVANSPFGGVNQSADFDPAASPSEYLSITSGLGSVQDRTRSLWIYLDAIPSVFATVLYIGYAGLPNQNYEVLSVSSATTGHVRFQSRYSTSTDAAIESLSALSTSTWYHVAWVYQGASIYLYIDGVLQGSTTNTVTDTSSYPAFFGAWHDGDTQFDGQITQARFYNQALTSNQIVDLYNENKTTYYRPATSLNTGEFRYNEQLGYVEYYDGSIWRQIADEYITGQPTTCICNYPAQGVSLYEFQDNANDVCGFYPLTEVGSPSYVTGKFGKAIQFNGTSQGVTSTSAVIPTPAATISLWYNGNGTALTEFYIIGAGVGVGSYGLDIHYYNSGFWAGVVDGGSFQGVGGGVTTVNTSTWYHLALTWDGSTTTNSLKLYLNGALETNITPTVAASSLTYSSFGIGKTATATYAPGIVDQVRIFDSVLTPTQITELYNEVICN